MSFSPIICFSSMGRLFASGYSVLKKLSGHIIMWLKKAEDGERREGESGGGGGRESGERETEVDEREGGRRDGER